MHLEHGIPVEHVPIPGRPLLPSGPLQCYSPAEWCWRSGQVGGRSYAHAARTLAIRIRPHSPRAHPASVPIIERSFTGLLARAGSGLSEGRCLVAYS